MAAEAAGQAQPSVVRSSGGGRALARDARVTLAFVNEARYRALASAFGASREQANVATFVAVLLLGHELREAWRRIAGPLTPDVDDGLLGTILLRELVSNIAGPTIRDTPPLPTLLLAAIILRWRFPVAVRAAKGIRGAAHRLDADFRHRYGYLVDVGQRRARHYEGQARKALAARQAN